MSECHKRIAEKPADQLVRMGLAAGGCTMVPGNKKGEVLCNAAVRPDGDRRGIVGGDAVGIVLERAPPGMAMGGMHMSSALAAAMGTDAGAAAGMIGAMQAYGSSASASSGGGAYGSGGGGGVAYGGAEPPAANGNVGLAPDMIEADVVMGQPLIIKPTASFSSNGAVSKLLADPNAKWTVHKLANRVSFMRQVSCACNAI